jgi:4-amino-4-deoxy-L-arabinose transferase-like glycosyltransferase
MRNASNLTQSQSNPLIVWQEAGLSLALFLLALAPRLIGLQRFVTADEAKWVYRSGQFWLAVLQGDWAGTVVKLKPAVTTMWSGGLGMWVYNRFHQNLPFPEFLATLPEWKVEPAVLHAARMPTILLTCAAIGLIYHLLRPSFSRWPAFFAGTLLAFDPLFLAHSRFLHHDALMTLFALPALLLAIRAARGGWRALIFSAILAGLAFLTKSPIFFLGPFVGGLFLMVAWQDGRRTGDVKRKLWFSLGRFAVWGGISFATFTIIWPAAWLDPIGLPLIVMLDALREAAPEPPDAFINLGPLYYLVHFVFYATLPVLLGSGVWLLQRKHLSPEMGYTTRALAWFALTFIIFMTLSDKRSARYILPAFGAITLVAAGGWRAWLARRTVRPRVVVIITILTIQLLAVIPYAPYYITYTNPFLGGPLTAPRLIKIGWGEGMDRVGTWLNQQPHTEAIVVGANYASTLTPYFAGQVRAPTADHLDYVVSYIKQRQGGSPEIQAYYRQVVKPVASISLAGIDYARIYPGPAVHPVESSGPLLAFRPHTHFAPLGQNLTVDLIWSSPDDVVLSNGLTLRQGDRVISGTIETETLLSNPAVTVTRHTLLLPADSPTGAYTLFCADLPLGQMEVRYGQLPANFKPVAVNFGDQVQLLGFNPDYTLTAGQLTVQLAFQASPKAWADYTVFVHLVDESGHRMAGHDAQPAPPTSQWLKGEVVLDAHTLTVPSDRPDQSYQVVVGLYRADTGETLGEPYTLPAE